MKKLATFAGVCLAAALIGCSSTQKASSVSPGAVEGKNCSKECSKECTGSSQASPGAVGDPAKCSTQCPHAAKASGDQQVSPGAVGDSTKASGCCHAKSGG